jgi:hypothetical protein
MEEIIFLFCLTYLLDDDMGDLEELSDDEGSSKKPEENGEKKEEESATAASDEAKTAEE